MPDSKSGQLVGTPESVKAPAKTLVEVQTEAGASEWKVDKSIVCSRCDFFKKACNKNWKEGQTNTINLPDDDAIAVENLLLFLYTLEDPFLGTGPFQAAERAEKTFYVADKYDVEGLRNAAFKCLKTRTESLADRWRHLDLGSKKWWVGFIKRVWYMESSTAIGDLKRTLIHTLVELKVGPDMIKNHGLEALFASNNEFTLDFIRGFAASKP